MNPNEDRSKDGWDKLEIIAKSVLPVVLAVIAPLVANQIDARARELAAQDDKRAREFEATAHRESLELQRKTTEQEIVVDLLPYLVSDDAQQRERALRAIGSLAPGIAPALVEALQSTPEIDDRVAQEIQTLSTRSLESQKVELHRANAQRYQDLGLNAQAYREYERALRSLPPNLVETVSQAKLKEAEENYERGNWATAARLIGEALDESEAATARNTID